jgi:hypothetical protein
MRKSLKTEMEGLYSHVKCISEFPNNNFLDAFGIASNNETLHMYMLYVASNVMSVPKCQGSSSLLKDLSESLEILTDGVK